MKLGDVMNVNVLDCAARSSDAMARFLVATKNENAAYG